MENMVRRSTIAELCNAGLNGDMTLTCLKTGLKFAARGAAGAYHHVDIMAKTEADYRTTLRIMGRSDWGTIKLPNTIIVGNWNPHPMLLEFKGYKFTVAIHTANHHVVIASNSFLPVTWTPKDGKGDIPFAQDANGNWRGGAHFCMHTYDTEALRIKQVGKTTDWFSRMHAAVLEAERLAGAVPVPAPEPAPVDYVVEVTGITLNVRTEPRNTSTSVGTVSKPEQFRIKFVTLGVGANHWGQINGGNHNNRWIALDYTKTVSAPPPVEYETYIVKPGDTLSKIALMSKTDTLTLAEINDIKNIDVIAVGQALRIPTSIGALPPATYFKYTVVTGDTLGAIAQKFGTTVHVIQELNAPDIPDADKIRIGQVIKIPNNQ